MMSIISLRGAGDVMLMYSLNHVLINDNAVRTISLSVQFNSENPRSNLLKEQYAENYSCDKPDFNKFRSEAAQVIRNGIAAAKR